MRVQVIFYTCITSIVVINIVVFLSSLVLLVIGPLCSYINTIKVYHLLTSRHFYLLDVYIVLIPTYIERL